MSYSAKAVANFFVERALASGEPLSPMKLIKLVYLAHGWNLAFKKSPLIGEAVQAWKYGPVIASLYHALKEYGNGAITQVMTDFESDAAGFRSISPTIESDDSFTRALLERVWSAYGKNSALQLSTATHQQGTPWWRVWHERGGQKQKGAIIPNDLIAEFFTAKRNGSPATTGA